VLECILIQAVWLAASPSGPENPLGVLLPFAVLILIFYFLLIRPQSRQRRKTQDMLANLKTGDRVITNGGLLGTIAGFGDNTIQLQVTSQIRLEVLRTAIASLQRDESAAAKKGLESGAPEAASAAGKDRK